MTYVIHSGVGSACAIIDPVLDYDPKSGRTSHTSADKVIEYVHAQSLKLEWILETHAHADHLTAAPHIKAALGGKTGTGDHIKAVQKVFKGIFNLEPEFKHDGSQFDHLFQDGESITVGSLVGKTLFVPGHTPVCVAYQFGDAVFAGDTLFVPDVGTARSDFPGGNAQTLYSSIHKLLSLPPQTRLFMCHDYPPAGRCVRFATTVAEQRANNIHVHDGISEAEFIAMRSKPDASLEMPILILSAVQINIRAGELPPKENNGMFYVKNSFKCILSTFDHPGLVRNINENLLGLRKAQPDVM